MIVPGRDAKADYFIGLIPPDLLAREILTIKEYFLTTYSSKASLNSPPHVTLHMPFEWREDKTGILERTLSEFSASETPFPVVLRDFGCFEPRVIFIGVEPDTALMDFQKRLAGVCRSEFKLLQPNHDHRPFHPHVTVAFRDLRKPKFKTAWEEFRNKPFSAGFTAGSLFLLKHDGKRWNVAAEFPIGQARP
jgi:2'-5' RNA ligase